MKRALLILLPLALLAAALAGAWWLARHQSTQAIQTLTGWGVPRSQAEQVVRWLGGTVESEPGPLVASGTLEGQSVAIVSELGGRVIQIGAEEGDDIAAGQVLLELDQSSVLAEIDEAQAAVRAAEATRDALAAGAHPAAILAAEATLHQAVVQWEGALLVLASARQLLETPQELDAKITEAQTSVELAAIQIDLAQAQIEASIVNRDLYRAQGSLEEKGLYQIYDQQVAAAEEALRQAQAAHEGAQATLFHLRAIRANPLALQAQVHQAEGQVEIAQGGVVVAQASLDDLKAGPTAEEMAVAEANVQVSQAALAALEVKRDMLVLRSPIDGMVTSRTVQAGEIAQPGAALMTVADLSEMTLTIYVPENELRRVYIGQEVDIRVDAFPQTSFSGAVVYISPQAEFTPRNVQTEEDRVSMVFAVRIRLPNPALRLKPGMPADVTLYAAP